VQVLKILPICFFNQIIFFNFLPLMIKIIMILFKFK
jgi:hypothetical protein